MATVVGNLWLVRLTNFILQSMANTNHKLPTTGATGVLEKGEREVQRDLTS